MQPTVGIHHDIPMAAYAQWEAVNQSLLTKFARTPAHAREYLLHPPEPSAAQEFGSAVHTAVLEPQRFKAQYVRAPVGDKRTKAVRIAWEDLEAERPDVIILRGEEYAQCEAMRDSAWGNSTVAEFLKAEGASEVCAVWKDAETGLVCKSRMDRLGQFAGWTVITDLKTTRDASAWAFAKDVATYQYHLQAAWYLDGLDVLSPLDRRFIIIAIEKDPPYCCAVYELDQPSLSEGRLRCREYLNAYLKASKSNEWPGYGEGVNDLTLPAYAFNLED